ncbi:MAG: hypothetical protein EOO00_02845 [Chitinophagaceae bacterium]|nr:MAG: hypothetical protein EOO00_02845 [Chitinophagaceae bacterium]
MKKLVVYRIITYILLFIAAFLSVGVFSSILAALANPAALLPLFLMACIIIYTYCSWRMLVRGIDKNIPCAKTLRELIRVNGYVTLGLSALCLVSMIVISTQPGSLETILEQVRAAQPPGMKMTEQELISRTQFTMRFLMAYTALLVIHVILTFRIVKRNPQIFEEPVN